MIHLRRKSGDGNSRNNLLSSRTNFLGKTYTHLNVELASIPMSGSVSAPKLLDFFRVAFHAALDSSHHQFKVGSVITQRNTIISCACNSARTHPFAARHNARSNCLHAEMGAILDALRRSNFNADKASIFVARRGRAKSDAVLCSYPCDACLSAIERAGIGTIICGDESGKIVRLDRTRNQKVEVVI